MAVSQIHSGAVIAVFGFAFEKVLRVDKRPARVSEPIVNRRGPVFLGATNRMDRETCIVCNAYRRQRSASRWASS